jgi:hypothetical protein
MSVGEGFQRTYHASSKELAGEAAGLPLDRFQILALDGGGAKALFTAHVLARLEQDLGVRIRGRANRRATFRT